MKHTLTKEDKMFLINTSIYNRDFFLGINNIRLSLVVAITAVVASVFSVLLTLKIWNPALVGAVALLIIVGAWVDWYRANKRIRKRINQIQKQYREYLTDLYPEIKESDFYY